MHIPDGYLSPGTCAALAAAVAPAWAVAAHRVRAQLGDRQVPNLALGAAFSFVIMMFNVPAPGGTTGHAVGSALVAMLLGPSAAVISTTVALAVQALLFGDGGVLALPANCLNLAVLMPLAAFGVYQLLCGAAPSPNRRAFAAGAGAWVGLNVAALATAVQLGLQPVIASDGGQPLYCPYGLGAAVPAMLLPHLTIFGFVEAAITAGVVAAMARGGHAFEPAGGARPAAAGLWAALGALCLLSPLGLLAAGDAWGEWAPADLQARLGFTPPGLTRLSSAWRAPLPDYNLPEVAGDEGAARTALYVLSGVLVVATFAGLSAAASRLRAASESAGAGGGTGDEPGAP